MENSKMAKEKKHKTVWPGVLFTIVVLLVILVIASPFIIDSILKVSIVKAIKNQLNVGASVSRVHLNIAAGSIEVNDLKINNPPGYEFEHILALKSINIKANIHSLTSDTVEVNQVRLNDAAVVIEQKGLTSNLADILKSMPKKPKTETEETKQKAKNVHVSSLDIRNIDVKAKLLPVPGKLDTVELKISALHFSDIGGKKTTLADVVGRIFKEIAYAITTQGSGVMPGELLGPIQENISETAEKIENIKKEAKDVTSQFKGLFKKKKKD
jgi:uncharacterized protein involved in outer membrane biogenesis